jgi:hypothetical protein
MPEPKPKRERTAKISARLPASLASSLLAEAENLNLTLSDVLRLKLSDADRSIVVTERKVQKVRREYTQADPDLLRQIAIIGNNLNQIARTLNKSKMVGSPIDLIANLSVLTAIEQELNKFLPPSRPN